MSVNIIFYPPNAPAFVEHFDVPKEEAQAAMREESGSIPLIRLGWTYEVVEVVS
jgi:hypothetical protein